MKKTQILTFSLAGTLFLASCGSNAVEAGDKKDAAEATAESVVYKINPATSTVEWHGEKVAYGHTGTIDITTGELTMEGDKLTSGKFVIDMNTIKETGNANPEDAAKLAGHLMAPDFFDAAQFPTTTFEITSAEKQTDGTYGVGGNLTIKGVTKNISFPAKITADGNKVTASAEFTINRNDWGVTYGSGISGAIGDNIISDDLDFKVNLSGTK